MSLKDRAKQDIERITSNVNEWAQAMTFHAPTGETVEITGLHTRHHLGVDPQLQKWANVPNAHVSVSEQALIDADYPYNNANGNVDMKDHRVTVIDSAGLAREYKVDQWFPNKTIGLITCLLGDFEA